MHIRFESHSGRIEHAENHSWNCWYIQLLRQSRCGSYCDSVRAIYFCTYGHYGYIFVLRRQVQRRPDSDNRKYRIDFQSHYRFRLEFHAGKRSVPEQRHNGGRQFERIRTARRPDILCLGYAGD